MVVQKTVQAPAGKRGKNGKTEPLLGMIHRLREQPHHPPFSGEEVLRCIAGRSSAIEKVKKDIIVVAGQPFPILITGDTGTGKELVVRSLHLLSDRYNQPFVTVNCAAIPSELAESELFGHVRGAFTGAAIDRAGKFEAADCGTLFLDEIGDLPLHIQAKVLRALEESEIERVGSNQPRAVDVRVLAATNKDMDQMVEKGKFREDLYYRLAGDRIHLPALTERPEDIPWLAWHFLYQYSTTMKTPLSVAPDLWGFLQRIVFPGNARQLRTLVERAAASCGGRPLSPSMILEVMARLRGGIRLGERNGEGQPGLLELVLMRELNLDRLSQAAVYDAMRKTENSQAAAKQLGRSVRFIQYMRQKGELAWDAHKNGAGLGNEWPPLEIQEATKGQITPLNVSIKINEEQCRKDGLPERLEEWGAVELEKALKKIPPFGSGKMDRIVKRAAERYGIEVLEFRKYLITYSIEVGGIIAENQKEHIMEALGRAVGINEAARELGLSVNRITNVAHRLGIHDMDAYLKSDFQDNEATREARKRLGLPEDVNTWTMGDVRRLLDDRSPFALDTRGVYVFTDGLAVLYGLDRASLIRRFKELEIDRKYIREEVGKRRKEVLIRALRQTSSQAKAAAVLGIEQSMIGQYCKQLRIEPGAHTGKELTATHGTG